MNIPALPAHRVVLLLLIIACTLGTWQYASAVDPRGFDRSTQPTGSNDFNSPSGGSGASRSGAAGDGTRGGGSGGSNSSNDNSGGSNYGQQGAGDGWNGGGGGGDDNDNFGGGGGDDNSGGGSGATRSGSDGDGWRGGDSGDNTTARQEAEQRNAVNRAISAAQEQVRATFGVMLDAANASITAARNAISGAYSSIVGRERNPDTFTEFGSITRDFKETPETIRNPGNPDIFDRDRTPTPDASDPREFDRATEPSPRNTTVATGPSVAEIIESANIDLTFEVTNRATGEIVAQTKNPVGIEFTPDQAAELELKMKWDAGPAAQAALTRTGNLTDAASLKGERVIDLTRSSVVGLTVKTAFGEIGVFSDIVVDNKPSPVSAAALEAQQTKIDARTFSQQVVTPGATLPSFENPVVARSPEDFQYQNDQPTQAATPGMTTPLSGNLNPLSNLTPQELLPSAELINRNGELTPAAVVDLAFRDRNINAVAGAPATAVDYRALGVLPERDIVIDPDTGEFTDVGRDYFNTTAEGVPQSFAVRERLRIENTQGRTPTAAELAVSWENLSLTQRDQYMIGLVATNEMRADSATVTDTPGNLTSEHLRGVDLGLIDSRTSRELADGSIVTVTVYRDSIWDLTANTLVEINHLDGTSELFANERPGYIGTVGTGRQANQIISDLESAIDGEGAFSTLADSGASMVAIADGRTNPEANTPPATVTRNPFDTQRSPTPAAQNQVATGDRTPTSLTELRERAEAGARERAADAFNENPGPGQVPSNNLETRPSTDLPTTAEATANASRATQRAVRDVVEYTLALGRANIGAELNPEYVAADTAVTELVEGLRNGAITNPTEISSRLDEIQNLNQRAANSLNQAPVGPGDFQYQNTPAPAASQGVVARAVNAVTNFWESVTGPAAGSENRDAGDPRRGGTGPSDPANFRVADNPRSEALQDAVNARIDARNAVAELEARAANPSINQTERVIVNELLDRARSADTRASLAFREVARGNAAELARRGTTAAASEDVANAASEARSAVDVANSLDPNSQVSREADYAQEVATMEEMLADGVFSLAEREVIYGRIIDGYVPVSARTQFDLGNTTVTNEISYGGIQLPFDAVSAREVAAALGGQILEAGQISALEELAALQTFDYGTPQGFSTDIPAVDLVRTGCGANCDTLTYGNQKQTVVLADGRIGIGGGINPTTGNPIQGTGVFHSETFIDYSQGLRVTGLQTVPATVEEALQRLDRTANQYVSEYGIQPGQTTRPAGGIGSEIASSPRPSSRPGDLPGDLSGGTDLAPGNSPRPAVNPDRGIIANTVTAVTNVARNAINTIGGFFGGGPTVPAGSDVAVSGTDGVLDRSAPTRLNTPGTGGAPANIDGTTPVPTTEPAPGMTTGVGLTRDQIELPPAAPVNEYIASRGDIINSREVMLGVTQYTIDTNGGWPNIFGGRPEEVVEVNTGTAIETYAVTGSINAVTNALFSAPDLATGVTQFGANASLVDFVSLTPSTEPTPGMTTGVGLTRDQIELPSIGNNPAAPDVMSELSVGGFGSDVVTDARPGGPNQQPGMTTGVGLTRDQIELAPNQDTFTDTPENISDIPTAPPTPLRSYASLLSSPAAVVPRAEQSPTRVAAPTNIFDQQTAVSLDIEIDDTLNFGIAAAVALDTARLENQQRGVAPDSEAAALVDAMTASYERAREEIAAVQAARQAGDLQETARALDDAFARMFEVQILNYDIRDADITPGSANQQEVVDYIADVRRGTHPERLESERRVILPDGTNLSIPETIQLAASNYNRNNPDLPQIAAIEAFSETRPQVESSTSNRHRPRARGGLSAAVDHYLVDTSGNRIPWDTPFGSAVWEAFAVEIGNLGGTVNWGNIGGRGYMMHDGAVAADTSFITVAERGGKQSRVTYASRHNEIPPAWEGAINADGDLVVQQLGDPNFNTSLTGPFDPEARIGQVIRTRGLSLSAVNNNGVSELTPTNSIRPAQNPSRNVQNVSEIIATSFEALDPVEPTPANLAPTRSPLPSVRPMQTVAVSGSSIVREPRGPIATVFRSALRAVGVPLSGDLTPDQAQQAALREAAAASIQATGVATLYGLQNTRVVNVPSRDILEIAVNPINFNAVEQTVQRFENQERDTAAAFAVAAQLERNGERAAQEAEINAMLGLEFARQGDIGNAQVYTEVAQQMALTSIRNREMVERINQDITAVNDYVTFFDSGFTPLSSVDEAAIEELEQQLAGTGRAPTQVDAIASGIPTQEIPAITRNDIEVTALVLAGELGPTDRAHIINGTWRDLPPSQRADFFEDVAIIVASIINRTGSTARFETIAETIQSPNAYSALNSSIRPKTETYYAAGPEQMNSFAEDWLNGSLVAEFGINSIVPNGTQETTHYQLSGTNAEWSQPEFGFAQIGTTRYGHQYYDAVGVLSGEYREFQSGVGLSEESFQALETASAARAALAELNPQLTREVRNDQYSMSLALAGENLTFSANRSGEVMIAGVDATGASNLEVSLSASAEPAGNIGSMVTRGFSAVANTVSDLFTRTPGATPPPLDEIRQFSPEPSDQAPTAPPDTMEIPLELEPIGSGRGGDPRQQGGTNLDYLGADNPVREAERLNQEPVAVAEAPVTVIAEQPERFLSRVANWFTGGPEVAPQTPPPLDEIRQFSPEPSDQAPTAPLGTTGITLEPGEVRSPDEFQYAPAVNAGRNPAVVSREVTPTGLRSIFDRGDTEFVVNVPEIGTITYLVDRPRNVDIINEQLSKISDPREAARFIAQYADNETVPSPNDTPEILAEFGPYLDFFPDVVDTSPRPTANPSREGVATETSQPIGSGRGGDPRQQGGTFTDWQQAFEDRLTAGEDPIEAAEEVVGGIRAAGTGISDEELRAAEDGLGRADGLIPSAAGRKEFAEATVREVLDTISISALPVVDQPPLTQEPTLASDPPPVALTPEPELAVGDVLTAEQIERGNIRDALPGDRATAADVERIDASLRGAPSTGLVPQTVDVPPLPETALDTAQPAQAAADPAATPDVSARANTAPAPTQVAPRTPVAEAPVTASTPTQGFVGRTASAVTNTVRTVVSGTGNVIGNFFRSIFGGNEESPTPRPTDSGNDSFFPATSSAPPAATTSTTTNQR